MPAAIPGIASPMQKIRKWVSATIVGAALFANGYALASAQAGGIPTAPAAKKVANDPEKPSAPASLRGYGGSALEPWLLIWLLPVSGAFCVGAATFVDRGVRAGRI